MVPPAWPVRRDMRTIERVEELLLDWYGANKRDLPWRRTTDPYAILVWR